MQLKSMQYLQRMSLRLCQPKQKYAHTNFRVLAVTKPDTFIKVLLKMRWRTAWNCILFDYSHCISS